MNITWHLVKKDLYRTWIPLALYAAFVTTKLVLGAVAIGEVGWDRFQEVFDYLKIAVFAEMAIGLVLIPVIVQEDPLVGTSAFWMTKPISGLRLLAVKVIVLAIALILLPFVLTLPWWFLCGFGPLDIALLVPRLLTPQVILLLVGLPFAVLTRRLSSYLVCGLVATLVWIVGVISFASHFTWSRDRGLLLGPGVTDTRGLIVAALTIGTVIAVVLHQYCTRRRPRSAAILGSGLGVAILVLGVWRWDWSPLWKSFSASPKTDAALHLEFESAALHRRSPAAGYSLVIQAHLAGIPAGHELALVTATQAWRFPDGRISTFESQQSPGQSASALLAIPPDARSAGHVEEGSVAAPRREQIYVSGDVPETLVSDITGQPLALKLTVRTRLLRPILLGETDLETSGMIVSGGRALRILNVSVGAEDEIRVSASEISLPGKSWVEEEPELFLFDRTAGLVVRSSIRQTYRLNIAGVGINGHTAKFPLGGPMNFPTTQPISAREALTRFRLARIAEEVVNDVHRTVELPHVDVNVK